MKKQNILICILIMMLSLTACGNNVHTEETSGTPSESRENIVDGENDETASGVRMAGEYIWFMPITEQEEKFLKEDIDQIQEIRFEYQAGNNPVTSMTFDFGEQKAYYGRKNKPEKEFFLTGEQINEIREILKDCAIYEWETRYEGTNGNSTGSFGWGLYYALEDGRIYTNAGWGVYGSMPGNFDILKKDLDAFWQEE